MAFRDILKKQRASGKGLLSSIVSASNKSMLESVDPRNKLFKKGSLLNALFPNVKGYSADGGKAAVSSAISPTQASSVELVEISGKLDVIGKNTMVLPIMMRDTNIMRQSLIKLVSLWGGSQRDKADRFFQTSKERESMYESQFKGKSTAKTPTPVASKGGTEGGFLDMLLKGLLGAGILAGIGKLMEDPEIRKTVKDYFQKIIQAIIDGVGSILSTVMETEVDIAGFKMSLGTAIAGTIAAFVGFKMAIAALTAYIVSKIGGGASGGIPSTIPDVPDKGGKGTPGKSEPKKGPTKSKMPKPGMGGMAGKALGIASIIGIAAELVYTSDDEISILRDAGFSKAKTFEKLSEEDQNEYLSKVYRKDVKDAELKAYRNSLLKKYNLEDNETPWRWKERYVESKSSSPSPTNSTPAAPTATPTSSAPAPTSTPTKLPTGAGTSGDKSFNQMSRAEQDSLLMNQAIAEGWNKPTSIQHSHNNPGNIVAPGGKVTDAQAKFGGVPGGTYNGLTFVKFPTMQAGWDAMRDLWSRKYGNQPVSQALATWSNAGKDQGSYNQVALGGASSAQPPTALAQAPSRPATQIASASTSLADAVRNQMQTPVIINAPTTNNNMQGGGRTQVASGTPSIVDTELMKLLVERVAA